MPISLKNVLALTTFAAVGLAASHPASAQGLDGTTVAGTLNFSGDPINTFNPYTAVVSETQIEFSYAETVGHDNNLIQADFTNNQLSLTRRQSTDTGSGGSGATYTFTDLAFNSVTELSDNFIGGLTYSLTGDTLTINQPAFGFDSTYKAVFQVNVVPVPEASTTVNLGLLLALGAGGIFLRTRRKRSTV